MQLPETTKLPLYKVSPALFLMGSLSPVSMDSLTSTSPSSMMASVQICLPAEYVKMSSNTICCVLMFCFWPSRSASTVGSLTMDSFSTAILLRISWKMPTTVFAKITTTNIMLDQLPQSAISKKMINPNRLKNVQMLVTKICK